MTLDLTQTGVYLRKPGSGEDAAAQKQAGMKWAVMNTKDHDPSEWADQRSRYEAVGIPHGPWAHVHDMGSLAALIDEAKVWKDGQSADLVGVNLEDVFGEGQDLREIAEYLRAHWLPRPVHTATLPWIQNGQGWGALDFATFALELFPLEQPYYMDHIGECIDHAFREGCKIVTLLFSTQVPRSLYPNIAHCLYTADDVAGAWEQWTDHVPQLVPQPPGPIPPPEVPPVPLTLSQFPYTGPMYGPSSAKPQTLNRQTVKGLKRAMIRLGLLDQALGNETDDYGLDLERAMKKYQGNHGLTKSGQYGRDTWTLLRYQKLSSGPNKGQYALDPLGRRYVQQDALIRCYPHPKNAVSAIGQGLHQTDGLFGNYAIDFMAPGGTKVLCVEDATIRQLSGKDPRYGASGPGIFGWSIHYETPAGYRYFSTHYGTRTPGLAVGQKVDCGYVLGTVGHWPGDPGRSHTHLGVTSPLGAADAKKRILEVSVADRIVV